ncbi:unnamed protein product [Boreogadus saida]
MSDDETFAGDCVRLVYSADRVDADHGLLKANMPQSSLKHSQEVKTPQKPPVLNVDQPHSFYQQSLRKGEVSLEGKCPDVSVYYTYLAPGSPSTPPQLWRGEKTSMTREI